MIIYLDESGNLSLNFQYQKTSRYLIIGLLVFPDGVASSAHIRMIQSVRRTLKNKLPKYIEELKGSKLSLPIKKYFLQEACKQPNWRLYVGVADKKSWVSHHLKSGHKLEKQVLYNELAKRIFAQVDNLENVSSIDLIVDCSKNKKEIKIFDQAITTTLFNRLAKNTLLSIKHRSSHEYPRLQAIDLFCSGVSEKYEHNNTAWYKKFSEWVAAEVVYKF